MSDGENSAARKYRWDNKPGFEGPLPDFSWETMLPCNSREGDDETEKAFKAFRLWLEIPAQHRSVAELERRAKAQDPDHAVTQFRFWHVRWRWQDRGRAYAAHLARTERIEKENRIREMTQRHAEAGASLLHVAGARIKQLKEKPAFLDPKDVVAFIESGVKVERQARGLDQKDSGETGPATPTAAPTEAIRAALQNPQFRAAAAQMLAELEAAETEEKK
jgi:hypothetical protein